MDKAVETILEYVKSKYPHLKNADSLDDIRYENFTVSEIVMMIELHEEKVTESINSGA